MRLGGRAEGFTIMELMVATGVFGVVLLLITTAVLQISRVYHKGITEAKVQNTTRNIADTIAQNIQFNGGNVTQTPADPTSGSSYAFCVGNQQYSYVLGYQLADNPTSTQTPHVLAEYNLPGCTSASQPQNMRGNKISGRELLAPSMRLSRLSVTDVGRNLYKVNVRVVFGDDDLLEDPNGSNASCKNQRAGTQFCAVSELTTIVTKRVE